MWSAPSNFPENPQTHQVGLFEEKLALTQKTHQAGYVKTGF